MFSKNSKIYAIVDQETCLENDIDILDYVNILYDSGIEIIQYRNKLENMLFAMKPLKKSWRQRKAK